MNILFLGEGNDACEMLDWTISHGGNTVVCVSGDELIQKYAEKVHISFLSLEEINQSIDQNALHVDLVISFLYGKSLKTN